ncbi:hypothetical protein [Elizabethkingia meningoseptica]|uniref:hypothetical protein n=1 Tax=Elizabethkingia meningoseptica TaxID=238 RepID=UPI003892819A
MKNQFEFKGLKTESITPKIHPDKLFAAMCNFCDNGLPKYFTSSIEEFFWRIPNMVYCIVNNKITFKGGRSTFEGKMVYATKRNLMEFLMKAAEKEELKDYLIAPIFETEPPLVGWITKTGSFCVYTVRA